MHFQTAVGVQCRHLNLFADDRLLSIFSIGNGSSLMRYKVGGEIIGIATLLRKRKLNMSYLGSVGVSLTQSW